MANRLKMDLVRTILALHELGWSNRRIARELGIDREAVGRHIRLGGGSKPATNLPAGSGGLSNPASNLPAGSDGVGEGVPGRAAEGQEGSSVVDRPDCPGPQASELPPWCPNSDACPDSRAWPVGSSKPASNPPAGSSGPASACQKHRELILAKIAQGLSAQRIWQDLVAEHQFTYAYDSVKRYVRKLGKAAPLPFRRMECAPGAEAQVDFGKGAPVVAAGGKRQRSHVLRIVLSHSRKAYSESISRQKTEGFIRCLENAFWDFGGVPRTLVIDNLKAAVSQADWFDPELNPKILAFCEHYGTVILPTRPYTPRHKGKVERGVDYVQENGLKGRTFGSLTEQNRHLAQWEATVADTRIHGTTRKQVGKLFQEVERPALLPLPAMRFPLFQEAQRRVHRDGHVEVEKAYYSVPPEYLGRTVWARWDGRLVRIFNGHMEQVAVHAQREAGRFSTQQRHIDSRKVSGVERGTTWLLRQIRLIGPEADRWAQAMLGDRGVAGIRVLQGLLHLAGKHPADNIEWACQVALSHGAFRLRAVRALLKRGGGKQEEFDFLTEHEIIRDMSDYGALVRTCLHPEAAVLEPLG